MSRDPNPQVSFADLEFRKQGIFLNPGLAAISSFLDQHEEIVEKVRGDLERGLKKPQSGRLLLLIPWALACAAFLFGAMKSHARFTHKHVGSYLELGGPVVLFCPVVAGGFKLVPPAPETFDLTVRPHSARGRDPIITSGRITIDLDTDRRTEPLGANGEADFKGIPPNLG